jgi:hypothetical protein
MTPVTEEELRKIQEQTHYYHEGCWYPKALETLRTPEEATKERVTAAEEFFNKHFTVKGLPKTSKATVLFQKYLFVTYYNLNQIEWRVRKEQRHEKILL